MVFRVYLQSKIQCFLIFALILGIILFPETEAQQQNITGNPTVTIPNGNLIGKTLTTRNGRKISAFLGIPYGEPPTGNRRFTNPIASKGWNGTLNASIDAGMCLQKTPDSILGKEDCLYLRVYTPRLPDIEIPSLLPVIVFIHGGAFVAESPPYSGPEYLLDSDVVLVTLNYRLGVLGFLSTGDEVASGNWGLKDQVLALEWVRDNIRFFGGDPKQVTIFGESAGSASVHLLTLSNSTTGLFHKYITQSGSALASWAHRPRTAYSKRAFEFGEYIGCSNDTSRTLIECLRSVDHLKMLTSSSEFVSGATDTSSVWGPTDEPNIKGALLTDNPTNLFAAGKIRDLPWISGVVRDEGLLMTTELYVNDTKLYDLLENLEKRLPIMLDWKYKSDSGLTWAKAAKSYYLKDYNSWNKSDILRNLTMLIGDASFYYPARKALQQQYAKAVNPQYFYSFNYRGTWSFSYEVTGNLDNYGVKHADDLIYLFPKDQLFSTFNKPMSQKDYEVVNTMVELWTSFAINGIPTTHNGVIWKPYSTEDKYLRIGNDSDPTVVLEDTFCRDRMQFWANLDTGVF